MPENSPKYGDSVCRDLACYYDTNDDGTKTRYEHRESWCAESAGTYFHIPGVIDQAFRTSTDIEDETKYNLPGSSYTRLSCFDGEVIPTECDSGSRDIICKETVLTEGYTSAKCESNDWLSCLDITNDADCEAIERDCKWIYGYTFNFSIEENVSKQGSCVPLFAPGLDFWNPSGTSDATCARGTVADITVFETYWMTNREKFEDVPTKDAAERCLLNCYSIPDYGFGLTLEQVQDFYSGGTLPSGGVNSYHLSNRRGQYCSAIGDSENRALGRVSGNSILCADNENRRIDPLFYTNAQWLDSIRTRARSLGDCGVKNNSIGEMGQPGSELITAIFDKLNQDGSVKTNGTSQTIYIGEERQGDYRLDE